MHIMSMLSSIAETVSSGNWRILFKVLTLNVAICLVRLYFSNFCFSLSSVAVAWAPASAVCAPFFTRAKRDAV